MRHGDEAVKLPDGFEVVARSGVDGRESQQEILWSPVPSRDLDLPSRLFFIKIHIPLLLILKEADSTIPLQLHGIWHAFLLEMKIITSNGYKQCVTVDEKPDSQLIKSWHCYCDFLYYYCQLVF
ncbi:unnamed protein product [Lactuca saligna]|uniref:Uncharacterized protein n=1 Tax=Lactuca saligna TaxID=75948 RepID=A0AA35ZQU6_LACSI|nr:unnamed protein product [Lactuca saligna]